jgi:hypothetical protein
VGGQYWRPVEAQQNVEADHYYLTRTYLLPAYMADWILLSKKQVSNARKQPLLLYVLCGAIVNSRQSSQNVKNG